VRTGDATGGAALSHDDLDAIWAPLHGQLNYGCLNDLPGLANPTSELLASWLWALLVPQLPGLVTVTVYETGSSFVDPNWWSTSAIDRTWPFEEICSASAFSSAHEITNGECEVAITCSTDRSP
jgi:6-pyruvoyl-tetrahydropterin synthase